MYTSYHPDILLLKYKPNGNVYKCVPKACTGMFIAALFVISRTGNNSNYLSIVKWIKKSWHIYTIEYSIGMRLNELVIHNNVNESQKHELGAKAPRNRLMDPI